MSVLSVPSLSRSYKDKKARGHFYQYITGIQDIFSLVTELSSVNSVWHIYTNYIQICSELKLRSQEDTYTVSAIIATECLLTNDVRGTQRLLEKNHRYDSTGCNNKKKVSQFNCNSNHSVHYNESKYQHSYISIRITSVMLKVVYIVDCRHTHVNHIKASVRQ